MPYLILFDIDHTLLTEKSVHRLAFHTAMREVYGMSVSIDDIPHAGMTDQQIIIGVLKKRGVEEEVIEKNLLQCKARMCDIVTSTLTIDSIQIMPGVISLLQTLIENGHNTGLVTGNLECIARKKMEVTGLSEFFPVGGFGSDTFERSDLIKLAISRAEAYYQKRFMNNVIFIGDTARDIEAGKIAHVRTLAVATGSTSYAELELCNPHKVVHSLEEQDEILNMLV